MTDGPTKTSAKTPLTSTVQGKCLRGFLFAFRAFLNVFVEDKRQ